MHTEAMVSPLCPEVEVSAKPERRRFTVDYKMRIFREADRCTCPGEMGALLRREGLYSSMLSYRRRARARGDLSRTGTRKRSPAGRGVDSRDRRISELARAHQAMVTSNPVPNFNDAALARIFAHKVYG